MNVRLLAWALAVGGCTAAGPPPVRATGTAPPPLTWLVDIVAARVVGLDGARRVVVERRFDAVGDVRALADGGAVAAVRTDGGAALVRLDGAGTERWRALFDEAPSLLDARDDAGIAVALSGGEPTQAHAIVLLHRESGALVGSLELDSALHYDVTPAGLRFSWGGEAPTVVVGGRRVEAGPWGTNRARPRPPLSALWWLRGGTVLLAAGATVSLRAADGTLRGLHNLHGEHVTLTPWASGPIGVVSDGGDVLSLAPDATPLVRARLPRLPWGDSTWVWSGDLATPWLVASARGWLAALDPQGAVRWLDRAPIDFARGARLEGEAIRADAAPRPETVPPRGDVALAVAAVRAFVRERLTPMDALVTLPDGVVALSAAGELWRRRDGRWSNDGAPAIRMHTERFIAIGPVPPAEGWYTPRALLAGGGGLLLGARGYTSDGPDVGRIDRFEGARLVEDRGLFAFFSDKMLYARASIGGARGGPPVACVSGEHGVSCEALRDGRWQLLQPLPASQDQDPPGIGDLSWFGGEVWLAVGPFLYRLEGDRWQPRDMPAPLASGDTKVEVASVSGSASDDVWIALTDRGSAQGLVGRLCHFDGSAWRCPVRLAEPVDQLWAAAPDDVWGVGDFGALHYDGTRWAEVAGVAGPLSSVGPGTDGDLWLAGRGGVWRAPAGAPAPSLERATLGATRSLAGEPAPLAVAGPLAGYTVERIELALEPEPGAAAAAGEQLAGAREVAVLPDGTAWLHDGLRAVEVSPAGRAHVLQRAGRLDDDDAFDDCQRCLAPTAPGEGYLSSTLGLHEVVAGRVGRTSQQLGSGAALAARGSVVFVVGVDGPAPALVGRRGAWSYLPELPALGYADVAVGPSADEAWLAGGLGSMSDRYRAWPDGAGVVLRYAEGTVASWQAPYGALLAVCAAGPGEAWAAGAAGQVVHLAGSDAQAFVVDPAMWLRDVWASGPRDGWFVGDDATILHFDGSALRRLALSDVDADASFTAIAGRGPGDLWAVGPAIILRIRVAAADRDPD